VKISIVTPSYNQEKYLERSILSVWRQEGDFELEHIVIDGGSKDQSIDILLKYDHLYKSNLFPVKCKNFTFSWESIPDKGQDDALNKGFAFSTGEILGWLNSDDIFFNHTILQTVCHAFMDHDSSLIVGNVSMIDAYDINIDNPILINSLDNRKFQKIMKDIGKICMIAQPSCFFKRAVWENLGIDHYYYCLDWDLWINAYRAGYRFYKIDDYLSSMRQHSEAKTVNAGMKKYKEVLSLYKKNHVWCFNRFYCYIYFLLLHLEQLPLVGPSMNRAMVTGKKIRNTLINRYRLY
jgi:glycosyltransferase involved in cell wall biosynthesis